MKTVAQAFFLFFSLLLLLNRDEPIVLELGSCLFAFLLLLLLFPVRQPDAGVLVLGRLFFRERSVIVLGSVSVRQRDSEVQVLGCFAVRLVLRFYFSSPPPPPPPSARFFFYFLFFFLFDDRMLGSWGVSLFDSEILESW